MVLVIRKIGVLLGGLFFLLFTLTSCTETPAPKHPPSTIVEVTSTAAVEAPIIENDGPTPTLTLEPERAASSLAMNTGTPPPISSPTPTLPPLPSPTNDVYGQYSIQAQIDREYGGGQLDIVETLEQYESFTRYLITYPSDGLTIYGFMNVPNEGLTFPVAIVVHGYLPPDQYQTLAYTTRYADDLAREGYFVVHPNLRSHQPSDSGPNRFRTGYAIDILNLIAIIQEQSRDPQGYLRRADGEDINLWGHSMGGGIVLRTIIVNNDQAIRSAVLYASMSGDESLNFKRILQWSGGNDGQFEGAAPPEALERISPIYHLDRLRAPLSIHHSTDDEQVPPEWSAQLCELLLEMDHPSECFTYPGQPHTFRGQGDTLFMDRVVDFFNRH